MDASLSYGTQASLIWSYIWNILRLTKISILILPKILYPKLDCGTPNLESFELVINNSLATQLVLP